MKESKLPRTGIAIGSRLSDRAWLAIGVSLTLCFFLTTLQTTINGSQSPYTTDTGEIQNALPRWGTIHWTGYPQYSLTGSLMVTLLRLLGVAPAAGASLVSALWGTVAVGLLILLARDQGAPAPAAVLAGWLVALSTSIWMDASLAEVHTLTVVFTVATLWFALRFGRTGRRRDFLWLAFAFSQGIVHQRAMVLLAPAVVVLTMPRWRAVGRHLAAAAGVSVIAPLTYLYLPFTALTGSNWTFGQIGSLRGLWVMLTDNRAGRVIETPIGVSAWWERLQIVVDILDSDLPWPLLGVGLASLLLLTWRRSRREALGLTLSWLPYAGLCLLIWIGRVGDAILAAKLPILPMVGLGVALALGWVSERLTGTRGETEAKATGALLLVAALFILGINHYSKVTAVTRDPSAEAVIAIAEQVAPPPDGQPTILMALWGHDFWALTYSQAYQDRLTGLTLVDHNADFHSLLAGGNRLWVLSKTFYLRPISWWDSRLRREAVLSSVAPGIVQIATDPQTELADTPQGPAFDLENGLHIVSAALSQRADDQLLLRIVWQAVAKPDTDYSVAVHLVACDPPRGPEDILSQSDSQHPVEGWSPTSRWTTGEYVTDHYLVELPPASQPVAVRVAMYHQREDGSFENSPWLSLPVGEGARCE